MASTTDGVESEIEEEQSLFQSDCSTFSNHRFFSSYISPQQQSKRRHNFITLLSAMQKFRVPFLPLKWEQRRPLLGRGGTSSVNQALMTLETSFAFKRIARRDMLDKPEEEVIRCIINEMAVLRHPIVRNHGGILELQGICWDMPRHKQQNGAKTKSLYTSNDEAIWPVLVFERSHFGDLYHFAKLPVGRQLGIEPRLKICSNIGRTIAYMQENSMIHGDIKPENILVFQTEDGSISVKVADFGFSVRHGPSNFRIVLPRSTPYYAPEIDDYPDFTSAQATKTDVFSFGMLCLWFIFEPFFSGAQGFPTIPLVTDLFNKKSTTLDFLQHLKQSDALATLAMHLVMAQTDADAELKQRLLRFFKGSLAIDPEVRDDDLSYCLKHLDPSISTRPGFTANELPIETYYPCDEDFQLSLSLCPLYHCDYRLRSHVVFCLERIIAETPTSPLSTQLAICYQLGFGSQNGTDKLRLLSYDKRDVDQQLTLIKSTAHSGGGLIGTKYGDLVRMGYNLPIHPGLHYMTQGIPETAKVIIKMELEALEPILGAEHMATVLLKATLSGIAFHQYRFREAEELELDNLNVLSRAFGEDNLDTIAAMANLSVAYAEQGKLAEAKALVRKVIKICETKLGKEHITTLSAMKNLSMYYYDECDWEKSEELLVEVLDIKRSVFGEEHASTTLDLGNLASIYRKQGRLKEAESLEATFMDTYERILDENSDTALLALLRENPEMGKEFDVEIYDDERNDPVSIHASAKHESSEDTASTEILPKEVILLPLTPVVIKSLSRTYRKLGRDDKAKQVEDMFHGKWSGEGDWINSDNVNQVLDMEVLLPACNDVEAEKFGIEVLPGKGKGISSGPGLDDRAG